MQPSQTAALARMTPQRRASDMTDDSLGTKDAVVSSPNGTDEAGDEDTTSHPSGTPDPRLPEKEEEELSKAASAALREDETSSQTGQGVRSTQEVPLVTMARAYQLEMCEESMKRNIIAVMDTGSGKTHVQVISWIKDHLELADTRSAGQYYGWRRNSRECPRKRTNLSQLIWFLAPTVALCEQQFKVITRQIPSVQVKLLSGDDNVDSWSSEAIWSEFLFNVKIVVSTYQILYDALSHAFVKLSSLALIVFDEAHNCVGKHPGRKIMAGIYKEHKHYGQPVPHILGLTASPSMSSTETDLRALEETLDAKCKSPTIHREELLLRVKRPTVRFEFYAEAGPAVGMPGPPALGALEAVHRGLDIHEDPYILHLVSQRTERSARELRQAVMKRDTFIQNQVWQLVRISRMLLTEIGPWAVDYFISGTVDLFTSSMKPGTTLFRDWKSVEKEYLAKKLSEVACHHPTADELPTSPLSDKVMVLLKQLASLEANTVGIVFADERIKVSILAHLISMHPLTKDKYRVGSAVGGSSYASRKGELSELWGKGRDLDRDLEKFRSGKLNLLVATSVLEEGIDVPVCNLVLCFDRPKNLKSFVQRRGRARKKDSNLIILTETLTGLPKDWESLEAELRKQCENDEKERAEISRLESEEHDKDEFVLRGKQCARVDMDSAKQHLDHFCRVLSTRDLVDNRPDYIIRTSGSTYAPLLSAEVKLPAYIPENVRTSRSAKVWKSEKNATKDAAFQAYLAIYQAGLLSENLLPFKSGSFRDNLESRAGIIEVSSLMSPWGAVVDSWSRRDLSCHIVTLKDASGNVVGEYDMTVPTLVPPPSRITVYPENEGPWMLEIGPPVRCDTEPTGAEADHTTILLSVCYGHRQAYFNEQRKHIVSFAARGTNLTLAQISSRDFDSRVPEEDRRLFLIRDQWNHPFVYDGILTQKPPAEQVRKPFRDHEEWPSDVPYLSLTELSRRTDLLHPLPTTEKKSSVKPYVYVLPVDGAKVDDIPVRHAHFGKLIPCIMHELEVQLLAATVLNALSPGVHISDTELIRAAISPCSSNEPVNYERLELLGDSVLKACVTVNVAALFPEYPEGYLSLSKDKRVSNSYLSGACVERGVDKFILDKPFTGLKWRPLFLDEMAARAEKAQNEKRNMSTKTLADVMEALIGAAYINGGVSKAVACMSTLLPDHEWIGVERCREILYDIAPSNYPLPATLLPLEQLTGYSFHKKSLLVEAMTHASYMGASLGSFERLEFIGDAILDYIIVTKLFEVSPPLPQSRLHRLKTAVVNGDFQAFLVMETCARQEATEITRDVQVERTEFKQPLWAFMMHSSTAIGVEQGLGKARHAELRGDITDALEHSENYPWALLSRLRARKFYSDLFESILGAVWIDSGSMEACEAVIERFGLLGYLRRLLRDDVEVTHPKESLGQLAVDRTVRYVIDTRLDGEELAFTCQVLVGGELKAEVVDGVDKEEVKTRAAEVAVRVMKEEAKGLDAMDLTP